MVAIKISVVSVVIVVCVFLQTGIRAHPTNDSSSGDDSCLLLEEELECQRVINMRLRNILKNKQQKINTLENKLCQLTTVKTPENELTTIKTPLIEQPKLTLGPVTATFISSFDHSLYFHGITKVEGKLYVLDNSGPNKIKVYEDLISFSFIKDIALSGTNYPWDIVYSNESKCVYISDYNEKCIWEMTTTGEHRLTKWLTNITMPYTLSLSNEGHLLVLRQSQSSGQVSLETYSLNAMLIRRFHLSQDVKDAVHVVQTSLGNFIISHRLNNASNGQFVISKLTNEGLLIHRFIPRNQTEKLSNPRHMSLDSDNNRLFVTDTNNNRVILFDSSDLTWSQVLVSQEMNGIRDPWRLFYDASKKHLFIAQYGVSVSAYEIH